MDANVLCSCTGKAERGSKQGVFACVVQPQDFTETYQKIAQQCIDVACSI